MLLTCRDWPWGNARVAPGREMGRGEPVVGRSISGPLGGAGGVELWLISRVELGMAAYGSLGAENAFILWKLESGEENAIYRIMSRSC
jgi:hypothetical protein